MSFSFRCEGEESFIPPAILRLTASNPLKLAQWSSFMKTLTLATLLANDKRTVLGDLEFVALGQPEMDLNSNEYCGPSINS